MLKKIPYRVFPYMNKHKAKNLMNKFNVIDKTGSIINCNN